MGIGGGVYAGWVRNYWDRRSAVKIEWGMGGGLHEMGNACRLVEWSVGTA